jgi:dynein heavy chain, axonemal
MPIDEFAARELETMPGERKSWFKKLVFSLTWFHSVLIERKRFKNLGWNVIYDFNDSDWETSEIILKLYVEETAAPDRNAPIKEDQPILKSPPW